MRHIADTGLDLIKHFEGFRSVPYLCPAKVWTIGYGTTKGVTADTPPITEEQATDLLRRDVLDSERAVLRLIHVPLTDNQFAALVSFTYNLGSGCLQRSSLRMVLNRGEYVAAPARIMRYVYAGGVKLKGLIRRRTDEANLFAAA